MIPTAIAQTLPPKPGFQWWYLYGAALVRSDDWPAVRYALDRMQRDRLDGGVLDDPRCVYACASEAFPQFSLAWGTLRYWSALLWAQQEAQQ